MNKRLLPILALLAFPGCAHEMVHNSQNNASLPSAAKFSTLPPAVQNTVRAQPGSAEITEVSKITNGSGQFVYRVDFQSPDLFPPVYVAENGTVVARTPSDVGGSQDVPAVLSGGATGGVQWHELPAAVQQVLRERASNVPVEVIDKIGWGNRVVYVISFKDQAHHPKLYIASDGTIMGDDPK